jgi:hypothetical protein
MGALADNPIRLVYKALWDLVEAQTQFTDAVPAGNRIKYTGSDPHPEKTARLPPADFPEVRLVARSMRPHLDRTSNGASLTVAWAFQVNSGSQLFAGLMDVDWAIFLAMSTWASYLMSDEDTRPTWNGEVIVRRCRPVQVDIEMSDTGKVKGWRDAWVGETDLWFATSDLQAA